MNDLIIKIVVSVALVLGVYSAFNEYTDMKATLSQKEDEIKSLNGIIETNAKTYDDNIKLIKGELQKANKATSDAIASASRAEKSYSKIQGELNEKTIRYNDLIAHGYRLRDPYAFSEANSKIGNSGLSGDGENNTTTTGSSDTGTADYRLSSGLTKYLVGKAIAADSVVDQLRIVQGYAKDQHQWILNNCNAVEAK